MSSKGKFWPAEMVCAHWCLVHQPSVLLIYVILLMISCFVLQLLALSEDSEWETSLSGSRLGPASYNITTSFLMQTGLN